MYIYIYIDSPYNTDKEEFVYPDVKELTLFDNI